MNKNRFLIILILVIAFILRVYKVDQIPPGLTWDEASLGYNAYSLLHTGRDEYGTLLPFNLKSFGDYKPAMYAYLTVPFVALFGLTELAVRLPSVISGVLSVFLVYLLTRLLFKNEKLSLSISLLMAVSPMAIQFSRAAFEANVALTLNLLATYLFIKGLKTAKWLPLAALVFVISLITYQASRLFVPLWIVALYFLYKDQFKWNKESYIATGLVGICGLLLFGMVIFGGQSNRLVSQNLFAYTRPDAQVQQIALEDGLRFSSPVFQILHGEWWSFTSTIFERYLIYFSPKMLFFDGDYSPRHSVPDLGVLYYFSLILIPLGIFYLLRFEGKKSLLVFIWLFLASIPAVLSRDLIQTLRALNLVFAYSVLEGAGLYFLVTYINSYKPIIKYISFGILCLLFTFNFLIYLDRYLIHMPKEQGKDWLEGYSQAIHEIQSLTKQKRYDSIVFTDAYGQSYIYYLFYTHYPPEKFQPQAVLDQPTVDVGTVRKIDNLAFRHIYWPDDRGIKNSLFIGTMEELPDKDVKPYPEFHILKDIPYQNGQPAFRILETSP